MKIELLPSVLASNFAQLGADANLAIEGGGSVLHVDVMDGHFVPNLDGGSTAGKESAKSGQGAAGLSLDD